MVEGVILVVWAAGDIADQGKTDLRVENVAGERGCLALRQIGLGVYLAAVRPNQHDLLAAFFFGRHLQRPAESVGDRERRLQVPRVIEVQVVVRNGDFVERWGEWWVER